MKKVFTIIAAIILVISGFAIESAIAMWLWNYVIVSLFNATVIDFWLACGIMLLINFAIGLFRNNVS